jgi:NAD(P)-dependent dehydrogenase (short-subunit alcohol dehydrogenase family)
VSPRNPDGSIFLVNNAGVPGADRPPGLRRPRRTFEATLRTNFTGTFLCTRAAFAWMAAHGGGRIINNGSIASHAPRAGAAAYAASKAAVASLTVSTALDGRDVNITATELDIGNARTELLLDTFTTSAASEPTFDAAEAARLLVSVAEMPPDVSVDRVTVTAAGMPYLGRG